MMAAHYRLKPIRLIVDNNKYQSQGKTHELLGVEP
jgi:transketolase N-terminal domain/subunit